MKVKIFILIVVAFISFNVGQAQTLCYKNISNINESTGVRSQGSGNIMYITFVKDGNICYNSDKNGNSMVKYGSDPGMRYKETNNGVLIYIQNGPFSLMTYKFSSDYNRLNVCVGGQIGVYERITDPSQAVTPETLY